jgi:hypothetical protein
MEQRNFSKKCRCPGSRSRGAQVLIPAVQKIFPDCFGGQRKEFADGETPFAQRNRCAEKSF